MMPTGPFVRRVRIRNYKSISRCDAALAIEILREPTLESMPSVGLVLLDADDDLPCIRGPELLTVAGPASSSSRRRRSSRDRR
jgi:hypothetical protein